MHLIQLRLFRHHGTLTLELLSGHIVIPGHGFALRLWQTVSQHISIFDKIHFDQ